MNLPPFIANPIAGGQCSYQELMGMTIDQVADLNEILLVRVVNERRAQEAAKKNANQQ